MDRSEAAVDVIIAAWKSSGTIGRAVTSALADPAVWHVIVVDDASPDDTSGAALACDDGSGRLVVERLPANAGPSRARNVALEHSSADWIAILDADDFFEPARVSKLLALADDADLIADDILQVAEDRVGRAVPEPLLSSEPFDPWTCDLEQFIDGNVSGGGPQRKELGFLKPLIRRAFLDRHQLRYREDLRLGEDFALYATALARGARFRVVPAQGYVSVIRPNSLSGQHSKDDLIRLRDNDLDLARDEQLSVEEAAQLERHYRSLDARVQWLEVIEAVKERDLGRMLPPFFRSTDVSAFLVARLSEQLVLRTIGRFGPKGRAAP